jgi:hypothetical protein
MRKRLIRVLFFMAGAFGEEGCRLGVGGRDVLTVGARRMSLTLHKCRSAVNALQRSLPRYAAGGDTDRCAVGCADRAARLSLDRYEGEVELSAMRISTIPMMTA